MSLTRILQKEHKPDLHPFPTGAHVFAEHDVVEGGGSHQEEQLLDGLSDEALVHAMMKHGGVEDRKVLEDG